jgi:tetratricopeptide (TPR) repeat protein
MLKIPRTARFWASCLFLSLMALAARADGGGGGGGGDSAADGMDNSASQPDYLRGVEAVQAQHWPDAIRTLERHLRANPKHADGHNWLAYAYRKSGQLDQAFRHYDRALGIDPQHLGAHEYIGEAYLQAGKPQEAERHLKRLAELCAAQCEQYKDLQLALTDYRLKH